MRRQDGPLVPIFRLILLLGVLAPFCCPISRASPVGSWHRVPKGPSGGAVTALAVDPQTPSTLYAGSPRAGIFRSHNRGEEWEAVNRGLPVPYPGILVLTVDPLVPSRVYAGTESAGLFRSLDGGDTWSTINNGFTDDQLLGLEVKALAVRQGDPSVLYAGTSLGVFLSTNGGDNWTSLKTTRWVNALAIDPLTPSTLYAGTGHAWWGGSSFSRSTDGGQSWEDLTFRLFPEFPLEPVNTIAVDPLTPSTLYVGTNGRGVFRSDDGGDTWTKVNNGFSEPGVRLLLVDPQTPTTLYAAATGSGGVYRSVDRGENWRPVSDGLANRKVITLTADPAIPLTLIAGASDGGVFRSSDGGETWSPVNNGLTATDILSLVIDPVTPSTLYAGVWGEGVFRSTDGGQNWVTLNTGLSNLNVTSLAVDPRDPLTLYAGTVGGGYSHGTEGEGVFRSLDGGHSWNPVTTGLTNLDVTALSIDPLTPSTIFAGTFGAGVFRSGDGGDNWISLNVPEDGNYVRALSLDPLIPSTLYVGTVGGVFRSMDGGESWTQVNHGLTTWGADVRALAIDPVTPSVLFAGIDDGGVHRSTNRGSNWIPVDSGLYPPEDTWCCLSVFALAVHPLKPTTVYLAIESGGVFQSTNGGESWSSHSPGLTVSEVRALAIDRSSPGVVWAGTAGGGLFVYRPEVKPYFIFPQIADGTVNTLQFQSTLTLTNTGYASPVRVEFYSSPEGEPMTLKLGDLGSASVFEFQLGKGELISLSTPGTGELQVGYARVSGGEGVNGVMVFSRVDVATNTALFETGVPASSELSNFSILVDSLGLRDTGIALVYPATPSDSSPAAEENAIVEVSLFDEGYHLLGKTVLAPLAPGGHIARYVHELFDDPQLEQRALEMRGILQVNSSRPLAAVTLNQEDNPEKEFPLDVPVLATFPVMPGPVGDSEPASRASLLQFPQFVDGTAGALRFQSTLILANGGPDAQVTVELFSTPDGKPMTLKLGELGIDSVFEFQLKKGESIFLPTHGMGQLQVGYARVRTGPGVGGVVVFRRSDVKSNVPLYEAGVPPSERLQRFTVLVDSLGAHDTGFAMVYAPDDPVSSALQEPDARVTLRLYDNQFKQIAETELILAAGSHLARFVHEIFEDQQVKARAQEMRGILVIESDQPVAALTLRQADDLNKEFPLEVPLLTTFPVIPGGPR